MYALIVTLTTFGFFGDSSSTSKIEGFKTKKMCEVAGEQFIADNFKPMYNNANYTCVKKG